MSISLHAILNLNSGIVDFDLVILNIQGQKSDFLRVVEITQPKNRFLVTFRSFFIMYDFFPGRSGFFVLRHLKGSILTKK